MSYPIKIWSVAYSPVADTEGYTIHLDKRIWELILRQEGSKRKFLKVEHPDGLPDWFAALGQPIPHETETTNIYMPLWMLDAAQLKGEGEESVLEVMDEEYFPEATKLVLRVIDSAFYNADVKDELEKALSSLGVIQEHTTLQIPVAALDGYKVEVFVSKTEPANLVFCHGEEVELEFEEPVDQIEHRPRPPTPIPQLPDMMLPEEAAPGPFQGAGHVLGSSTANIPEWRRVLGPPRPRR